MPASAQAPRSAGSPSDTLEPFVVSDVAALQAIADPFRLRLVLAMRDRVMTVKEMAAMLGVPQTRLYYHVKILTRHGFLRVAGRRIVSGIEERSYESMAKDGTTIAESLISDPAVAGVLKAMFDLARAELQVALRAPDATPGDASGAVPLLNFTQFWVTPDDMQEFHARMIELQERYTTLEPGPGKEEFHGVFAMYRVEDPASVQDDE
jgi:DNA-binding transcriptional ArsR family regulator